MFRRFVIALFFTLVFPAFASAQKVVAVPPAGLDKSFAINTLDTLYIAFRGVLGEQFLTDTTTGLNPYDAVWWNGDGALEIERISGSNSDSAACQIFCLGADGQILVNTGLFVVGTNFTTGYANVGDGSPRNFAYSAQMDPCFGLAIVFKMGDLTGGTRRWRFRNNEVY